MAVDERRLDMAGNLSGAWLGAGARRIVGTAVNAEAGRDVEERSSHNASQTPNDSYQDTTMKKILLATAILFASAAAFAQAGTAIKETGKATVETAKQGKENVQGAMTGEPKKTMHKTKARMHKASAKSHMAKANAAASAAK